MRWTAIAAAAAGMAAAALSWGTPVFFAALVMAVIFPASLVRFSPSPMPFYHVCMGEILVVIAGQASITAAVFAQAGVLLLVVGSTDPLGNRGAWVTVLVPLIFVLTTAVALTVNTSVTLVLAVMACIGVSAIFGLRVAEYQAAHGRSDLR